MSLRIPPAIVPAILLALACPLAAPAPADAGMVLQVQSVNVAAGSTGNTLEVFLMNTGPSAVSIAGFSFGLTSSAAVSFTDVTTATAPTYPYIFAGNSGFGPEIDISSGPGSSVLAADNYAMPGMGASLAAGATVGLGLVSFDLAANASGMISVNIQQSTDDTALTSPGNGSIIPITTFNPGTITVTPGTVPEPGSLALLATGVAIGLVVARARAHRPA